MKLLPCPFCGEKKDIIFRKRVFTGKRYWFVECLPCDARTGDFFDCGLKHYNVKSGKEMAANAWNRRE